VQRVECNYWTQEIDTRPFGPPYNTSLYEYDEEAGGYSCFFGNSNGMAANFKKLNDLALGIWTDKYTESVYIKMALYNGVGGVFTYVSMRFLFGSTGVLYPPHMVSIESVDFEPYDRPQDIVRLALEIIFLFWIGYDVGKCIIDAWYVFKRLPPAVLPLMFCFAGATRLGAETNTRRYGCTPLPFPRCFFVTLCQPYSKSLPSYASVTSSRDSRK